MYKQTVNFKTIKNNSMKKIIAIFAVATTLVACGGKGTEQTSDSTAVVVDSAVVTQDTTAAPTTVAADSTVTK